MLYGFHSLTSMQDPDLTIWSNLGSSVSLEDTLASGQVEVGIRLPTLWLQDGPVDLLNTSNVNIIKSC